MRILTSITSVTFSEQKMKNNKEYTNINNVGDSVEDRLF
jgi:hypothetical protein